MLRLIATAALLGPGFAMADVSEANATVPAYILQLPDSVDNVLIAETATATLYRYQASQDGVVQREDRYISVGQNGVGKQRAWDRRTPLGIYFANEQLDTSRLHDKYGATAFSLDYPNAWDRFSQRTGDGIWIHGVDPAGGRRPPLDTDGCIALPNDQLLDLEGHLQLLVTPVIITRSIATLSIDTIRATRDDLQSALDTWVQSYRTGEWHTYLALYAEDFEYRGLDREKWSAYRVSSGSARPVHDFTIEDVLLLADPEEEDLYLSRFRQTIVDENGPIVTIKRLYWRRHADGYLRIIAEDNG